MTALREGAGCVFRKQRTFKAGQRCQNLHSFGTAFPGVGPTGKLVKIGPDTRKLPDTLFLQRGLPQTIVQRPLAQKIRNGLSLHSSLGSNGFFLLRCDAQLEPCAAPCRCAHILSCLWLLCGVEGRHAPASPGRGHRVSVCPQRVGWLCGLPPYFRYAALTGRGYPFAKNAK